MRPRPTPPVPPPPSDSGAARTPPFTDPRLSADPDIEPARTHGSIAREEPPDHDARRRDLLLALGWGAIGALIVASVPATLRFLWPRGSHAGNQVVELGSLADYRASTVTTRWIARHGLWLVHRDGRLFALEGRCTHLGCTPRWVQDDRVFLCPCHGSRFSETGVALNGPASQPLRRLAIRVERDQVLVDRATHATMEQAERDPRFFVAL